MAPAAFIPAAPVFMVALLIVSTLTLSLTALFGTLVFFDLRVRMGEPVTRGGDPYASPAGPPPAWLPPNA